MTEAIERLVIVVFLGGLAVWLAQDVRRNLQTGVIRYRFSFSVRADQSSVRGRDTFGYWAGIILKMIGVLGAALFAAIYLYLSAIS